MESDHIIIKYVINVLGGAVIGVALLSQFFINAGIGKVTRYDSIKRKVIAYSIRISAAIISFAVLIFIIRMIKTSTTVTLFSALAIAVGLVMTLVFGWKLIKKRKYKIKNYKKRQGTQGGMGSD